MGAFISNPWNITDMPGNATPPTESPAPLTAPGYRHRALALAIGYLLLYVGAFQASALLDQGGSIASLWYLPAGLTVFGMLAFSWAGVALDAAGSALTLLWVAWRGSPLSGEGLLSGIVLHAAAYAAAILPLRRLVGHASFLARPAQIGWFLIAAALGTVLAAGVGMARLGWLGFDFNRMRSVASTWLIGDFIGIITLVPLLLVLVLPRLDLYLRQGRWCWPQGTTTTGRARSGRQMLGDGWVLALTLLGAFGVPWSLGLNPHSPFATLFLLLPLAWVALRGGLSGAVVGAMVLDSGLVWWVALFNHGEHALEYQLVMIAIALTGLLLGGAVEERNQARDALQTHAARLEQEVAAKTGELQFAYQVLALKERHQRALIDAAPVGIAELDVHGCCRYLNPIGCALTACSEDAAQGRHIFEFVHPDDRDYVEFVWQLHLASRGVNWLEFRLHGTDCWISAHWINLVEAGPAPAFAGSIIIFVDNTDQRRKDQQLWIQAHYDALTELPNRNLFWERLDQSLRRAKRGNQQVGLLWVDLDGFKAVNDNLGHAAGDELLRQAAIRLNSRVRDSDTVARMGGDEFTVILPDVASQDAAVQVAEDLTVLLAEPFPLGSSTGLISASIGVTLYPSHADDVETLVQYADKAMYAAKNAGKNQVRVWQPSSP